MCGNDLPRALKVALEAVQDGHASNRLLSEHLGITLNAAYKRTRRLRDLGYLHSTLIPETCDGAYLWRDENGIPRCHLEFFIGDGKPDLINGWLFDPTKGGDSD